MTFWRWLLLLPLLGVALIFLSLSLLVLSLVPPLVGWISFAVVVVVVVWVFCRRGSGAVSEGSLMGRQSSKEGLL